MPLSFQGQEALQQKRGTKDGEHLIVRTSGGGAELYSWSMAEDKYVKEEGRQEKRSNKTRKGILIYNRWTKIGDVVDSDNQASKQVHLLLPLFRLTFLL